MSIGKHVATLNLFQEDDGSFHITVMSVYGDIADFRDAEGILKPIDTVENHILSAAETMRKRKQKDGSFRC